MYQQEFDASEFGSDFDYLNAGTPEQFKPTQTQKVDEISGIERFWNLTGNLGEFGAYFSGGLAASLIIRGIPALIPAAVILVPGIGLGLAIFTASSKGSAQVRALLILIAIGTALIAGNWDAWLAWIIANSQMLIFSGALIVITFGFVGTQIWSKLSNVK
ncbi:hypothetical protein [Microcoleus sp. POL10_C6]|uniref:hypothetical protein n=1 Tax=Microcoleus sp. POL10_C6 TaxID=2818852 RepID=UPI002FD2B942